MRFFLTLALFAVIAVPAHAEETATAAPDAARVELATQMHDIWPVSTRVEEAISMVADDVPDNERDAFKSRMRKAIDQEELKRESIAAMAKTYSEAELKAMVEFYGSAEGRSISAKTEEYMKLLQPVMVKMLDSALLKMRTGAPLQSTPPVTP